MKTHSSPSCSGSSPSPASRPWRANAAASSLLTAAGGIEMAAAVASDQEFVAALRDAIGRYFAAVDRWESVYCQYYRLPGGALKPSSDLVAERREFEHRRRDLEELLPRARSLCFKYGQRDVFTGLRY